MRLGKAISVALTGVVGSMIEVETDIASGLPCITVVGLGDTAVAQARERVRAAIANSGFEWPDQRVTISLAPAGIHKRGAGYDLAMAIALLAASGQVDVVVAARPIVLGELGLDGTVRPIKGVLPRLLTAVAAGYREAIVPVENLAEALLVKDMHISGVATLADLVRHMQGIDGHIVTGDPQHINNDWNGPDMSDVHGQPGARFALEMAAAGGHHMLLMGSPGAGKTMLASRLPGLLPPLTEKQSLRVTALHSIAGMLDPQLPLVTRPPFIDPHHSASLASMIGGGSGEIRPGSASLAHHGVLFLDEAPEFRRTVLDALRQPMESGAVLVARAKNVVRFAAQFQLVLAANPCPCAAARDIDCRCAAGIRRRYINRLSGPLLDRIDIRVNVPAVDLMALASDAQPEESSATIRERVLVARDRARYRWRQEGYETNAEASGSQVRRWWNDRYSTRPILARAMQAGHLTARGYDRVLRLALTAADLADRGQPADADIATALMLRSGEAA